MRKILILLFLVFGYFSTIFSQYNNDSSDELDSVFFAKNYIGGSVGYQLGSIMESKYNPKSGISASIYYQRIKENNNYKIEFKYGIQKVFIENLTDKSYLNSNYNYHYLNFNVNNAIKLLRREKFSFQFLIGPTLQINLRTNSNGFGYNSISIYDIDSTGSLVGTSIVDNWNEVSANSKDLARISIGADLGFNFCFSINRNIDLSIENKYTFYLTNFTRNLLVPNFANGSIDLGFRFKIY